MPELPEVETIKRGLQKYLIGHKILDLQILDPLRINGSVEQIIGSEIIAIQRRGKGLIIDFENEFSLAIHVKMTGQLIYRGRKTDDIRLSSKVKKLPNIHTRIIFHLDSNAYLYYNDVRRFGWMKVIPTKSIDTIPFFKTLGPEPFGEGSHELVIDYFKMLLKNRKTPIKILLLDQQKIGGIGNIYANDALYEAKIDPRRPANSLNTGETESLFTAIHDVMAFSIEHGAASDTNYVDALGQDGNYQNHFRVYGRTGEKCERCGTEITRIVVGGRGTFICSQCQK
jgi:formamidopyrimidine-DNA glycosylase